MHMDQLVSLTRSPTPATDLQPLPTDHHPLLKDLQLLTLEDLHLLYPDSTSIQLSLTPLKITQGH